MTRLTAARVPRAPAVVSTAAYLVGWGVVLARSPGTVVTDPGLALLAVSSVALGYLTGRWWSVAVPALLVPLLMKENLRPGGALDLALAAGALFLVLTVPPVVAGILVNHRTRPLR